MKVTVDFDLCMSTGTCTAVRPAGAIAAED